MKSNFQYAIILLSLISIATNAQENKINASSQPQKVKNLQIGDIVPPISIPKVINDTKKTLNTSDFKDQLLIIDFWATTCGSCVEGLPKIVTLQKQFGNQIKILPVTFEDESLITAFIHRNKLIKGLKIVTAVEDKTLSSWFKHFGLPHEIWIYKSKVIAVTSGAYIDAYNIQAVLDGKELHLPVKDDFYQYNYKKPFASPLGYVAIAGYIEGAKPKFETTRDSSTNAYRTYFVNKSILSAYNMLWKDIKKVNYVRSMAMIYAGGINPNQIILEVKNPNKYIYNPDMDRYQESWERKYDISYEWLTKDTIADLKIRNKLIINDLDRFLGLKGRWEKRAVKSLALVRTDTLIRVHSVGGESIFDYKSTIKQLHNGSLSSLVFYLNNFPGNPPVFDETDYKDRVDLDLDFGSWTDIPAIRKTLQPYGLDLIEVSRELDMFVLTENNWNKP